MVRILLAVYSSVFDFINGKMSVEVAALGFGGQRHVQTNGIVRFFVEPRPGEYLLMILVAGHCRSDVVCRIPYR